MFEYLGYTFVLGVAIFVVRGYFAKKYPPKQKFSCKDCPRAKECEKKDKCQ